MAEKKSKEKATEKPKSLVEKIGEIQQTIDPLIKDKKVSFGKTSFDYYDINQLLDKLLPEMEKQGLVVMQPIEIKNDYNILKTIISDGEKEISSEIRLTERSDPQDFGSDNTYMRRYALASLLGLRVEDDDGKRGKKDSEKKVELARQIKNIESLDDLEKFYHKYKGQGKWFATLITQRRDEIKGS